MFLIPFFVIPFIAIIQIALLSQNKPKNIFNWGLFWSLLILIYYIVIWLQISLHCDYQFYFDVTWFNNTPLTFSWNNLVFSCDGISFFFIGLSIILIPICILISYESINNLYREFVVLLFLILEFLIGVFTIMDILGFYILFEAILIPMFIIIGVWGSREQKVRAAFYFFFYTLIGSLLMLLSIFKIYSLIGSTSYYTLISSFIPSNIQIWLFIGFFASLSVKIPMIPFHIWLPQAHVEAPVSGSVLLAGILLKLGGYGFIRFAYPLFPVAYEYFSPFIIMLSLIAIIYASFTTCRQSDVKRLIAYSSVSHMGLVTLALYTHSVEGLAASVLMMLAHGLVSSGLFMTTSILYVRHHTRVIKYYRGIVTLMPLFSSITLILILGNISFPLTLNFIAEFISITAALNYSLYVAVMTCIGILLGTIYSFYLYNRMHFGVYSSYLKWTREVVRFEFNSFLPIILLTLFFGIFPNLLISPLTWSYYINISL